MALTTIDYIYKKKLNTNGRKLNDWVKTPGPILFEKDQAIYRVCKVLDNTNACRRILLAGQNGKIVPGGPDLVIDDVQYTAVYGSPFGA